MKILVAVGTRPEAIKLAPVILKLTETPSTRAVVVATAQHREMLDQVFTEFGIAPDHDLDLMRPGQTLAEFASRCLSALDPVIRTEAPDAVIAQGDTTTTFVAALASFYNSIPFAHVEAGLRTRDFHNPFPEEFNRVATSHLAGLHFAPAPEARDNLLRDGVADDAIIVT